MRVTENVLLFDKVEQWFTMSQNTLTITPEDQR